VILPIGVAICKTYYKLPSDLFMAVLFLVLSSIIYIVRILLVPYTALIYVRNKLVYFSFDFFVVGLAIIVKIISYSSFKQPGLSYIGPDYLFTILLPGVWTEHEIKIIDKKLHNHCSKEDINNEEIARIKAKDISHLKLKTLLICTTSIVLLLVVAVYKSYYKLPTNSSMGALLMILFTGLYALRLILAPITASLYLRNKRVYFFVDALWVGMASASGIASLSLFKNPIETLLSIEYLTYILNFMILIPWFSTEMEIKFIKEKLIPREVLAIDELKIHSLSKYYENLTCWKISRSWIFIPFKEPIPIVKNSTRLVIKNITIALKSWPISNLSEHVSLGLWTDKPIVFIKSNGQTIVSCFANIWIGVKEGFNDIVPKSRVFTIDLDSLQLRTGKSRGVFKDHKAVGIVVLTFEEPEKCVEYIDLSRAYITYM